MKKTKLLTLLSIPFMISCGNKVTPNNPVRPIPEPIDPPKPIHYHDFNAVTGSCSCGLTYATEIKYTERDFGQFMFEVVDKKVYFNFETECQTSFYLRTDVLGSQYGDKFNQCISNIELYNSKDLTTNLFSNHNYTRQDANTHTESPFSWYESNESLEAESKFYCIVLLADFVKETEVPFFIELYNEHSINDENWVNTDDGTKRTNKFHCSVCDKDVIVEETYLLDITLPEMNITTGIDYSENIVNLNNFLNDYEATLKVRIVVNYINSNYYGTTPESDSYTIKFQLLCYFGYAFDKDRTTFKYVDGTLGSNLNYFSHNKTVEFELTIPKNILSKN